MFIIHLLPSHMVNLALAIYISYQRNIRRFRKVENQHDLKINNVRCDHVESIIDTIHCMD
jgi:hypothetical protein